MGSELISDFVVDMNTHCFLCLEPMLHEIPAIPEGDPQTSSIHSLHYLSRYLKMNLAKIFDGKGPVPPQLLANVGRSKLKVTLCGGCGSLTEKFSALYRQLEKTETEVNSCLNTIHGKLLEAIGNGRREQFRKLTEIDAKDDLFGSLEIVEVLRGEAMKKCSYKLNGVHPRVRIHKWSKKSDKLKFASANAYHNVTEYSGGICESTYTDLADAVLETSLDKVEASTNDAEGIEATEGAPILEGDIKFYECVSGTMIEVIPDMVEQHYGDTIYEQNDILYEEPQQGSVESIRDYSIPVNDTKSPTMSTPAEEYWQPKSIFNSKTRKHKCGLCSREYVSNSAFVDHYRSDHLQQKYKCEMCPKEFTFRQNHERHLRLIHKSLKKMRPNPAPTKKNGSVNKKRSTKSQKDSSAELPVKTSVPSKTPQRSMKKRKEASKKGLSNEPVDGSDSQKKIRKKLRISLKPSESAKGKVTSTKRAAAVVNSRKISFGSQQYSINPKTQLYKCKKCSREFTLRDSVYRHYKSAHLKIRYKCTICLNEFASLTYYNCHYKGVHMGEGIKCQNCGRSYLHSTALRTHHRISRCGAGGASPPKRQKSRSSGSKQNISTKIKKKKFSCRICRREFALERYLKSHMKTVHSHSMEHGCDLCGKKFPRKDYLARHLRKIHQTEKTA